MYIKRTISETILAGSKDSPVISVLGPRQSGKNTLCKQLFPHHAYVDMQDPAIVEFARSDPKGFLQTHMNEHGIIIDEAQYAPILFHQIKVEVDKDRHHMGRYILTSSHNFRFDTKITGPSAEALCEGWKSLAGRVYIYKLLPLSLHELSENNLQEKSIEKQIFKGFYPNLYGTQQLVSKFYESYFNTYVERDVRSLRNIENLSTFTRFIQLCIARIGQTINMSSLANDAGISVITVRSWLSILEASFILFLLPSYHTNMSKRIIKSPKLYFYDVGLAANIAGISLDLLKTRRDVVGQLFENMMIVDLMKECTNLDKQHQFFFFRDSNLKEVDCIIETGGITIPIEIKSSMTLQSRFLDTLVWLTNELKLPNNGVLIYSGDQSQLRSNAHIVPWHNAYQIISALK